MVHASHSRLSFIARWRCQYPGPALELHGRLIFGQLPRETQVLQRRVSCILLIHDMIAHRRAIRSSHSFLLKSIHLTALNLKLGNRAQKWIVGSHVQVERHRRLPVVVDLALQLVDEDVDLVERLLHVARVSQFFQNINDFAVHLRSL